MFPSPPVRDETLPITVPPFLPQIPSIGPQYTLVLDLDETLIHYYETETEGHILVRPGCETMLKALSQHYEIVVFTAAM